MTWSTNQSVNQTTYFQCLCPPTRIWRVGSFWVKLSSTLQEPQRYAFSVVALLLWNNIFPKNRLVSTFLIFPKCIKTFLYQRAWKIYLLCVEIPLFPHHHFGMPYVFCYCSDMKVLFLWFTGEMCTQLRVFFLPEWHITLSKKVNE